MAKRSSEEFDGGEAPVRVVDPALGLFKLSLTQSGGAQGYFVNSPARATFN